MKPHCQTARLVERLRSWRTVHLARLHLLIEEAADEMERLLIVLDTYAHYAAAVERRLQSEKISERERANHPEAPDSSTLTDEEREAVRFFSLIDGPHNVPVANKRAATLRGLLARLSPPAT